MRSSTARQRRISPRLKVTLAGLALVVGACSATSPSPDASPGQKLGFRLRATTVQALPPIAMFTWTPQMVITDELVAIQQGAITLIFPGPLVAPLIGTQLTEEAWTKIVAEARAAGLLSGESDFTGGGIAPGAESGRLQLVVDGRLYDLTGDPSRFSFCGDTICPAEAGTPEAFATFFSLLGDLQRWVGGVGPQAPWTPSSYAVLVGPPPANGQGLAGPPLPWPFLASSAAFGPPVAGEPDLRCGTVTGQQAAAFSGALGQATQLTTWRDPEATLPVGLTVRPILPGDGDPCAPLVGG